MRVAQINEIIYPMQNLLIPADAFSHGQIRSKTWLAEKLELWSRKHMDHWQPYILNWYGCWVGVGPFLLLMSTKLRIVKVKLVDLDQESLNSSLKMLDFWRCEGREIEVINGDVNRVVVDRGDYQLFVNTSCEHLLENEWLARIPRDHFVLLQSTNMKHVEHVNLPENLDHFAKQYSPFLKILELEAIDFSYPDKKFSRYMLFGKKL